MWGGMHIEPTSVVDGLREHLATVLSSGEIQWNKQGILAAFDRACAKTMCALLKYDKE